MRFSSAAQRGKSLMPVAVAALALAACGHRHEAEPETYVSIKDQPQVAAPAPIPAVKPPLVKSASRQRLGGHVPTESDRGASPKPRVVTSSDISNSYVAVPRAPKAQASLKPATEPVKMAARDVSPIVKDVTPKSDPNKAEAPKAPQVAAVPMPPANTPAPVVPKAIVVEPAPAKVAAVPAPTAIPAPPIVTPKVELIPAPMSDASPTNRAAKAPAVAPQAPIVAPKMIAKAGDTAPKPSTKTTSLSDQVRIKDALDRADMFLKTGQVPNARALLQDAARGENADLLTALAATYDPIVLVDYPSAAKSADPKRAVELYEVAIAKGSVAAKERMSKLKEQMSKVQ
ncbi:MAG: hypothetical protein ABL898_17795 [Hyphomicrobiaceae bacterium]|nr:hypothetical protein [Hyphomicrobiaceae bacterium]